MNTRAKWAYLSYDSMIEKIQDGTLDAYDVIYCTTTKENYIVSPDLQPWSVKSKIYTFNTIDEANISLNTNTDTYVGQIVSVLSNDTYKGYIVNKNENSYYVEPINNLDYDLLKNIPIKNIIGSLDYEIILDSLSSGVYKIKGQYKITQNDTTTYLSTSGDFILIDSSSSINIFIKRITKDTITDFKVFEGNVIESSSYVTEKFLKDSGYATTDYVNTKVLALEESIKKDIESYVEDIVGNKIDSMIDERLETQLDGMIEEIPNEDVRQLFS